jgi:hypothetical protein
LRVAGTLLNGGEVFHLFLEILANGFLDQRRHGSIHGRCLPLESLMKLGLEIDGGALECNSHESRVAIQPERVKREKLPSPAEAQASGASRPRSG